MSKRAKTRFCVEMDGVEKDAFSVKLLENGNLLIVSGYPTSFEEEDGKLVKFVEQHYSVHISNGGKAATITQKTTLAEGKTVSAVSFVNDPHQKLLWPVFSRRLPVLDGGTRDVVRNSRDVFVNIGSYFPISSCLMYSVFVARDFDEANLKSIIPFSYKILKFGIFQIIVITNFINCSSPYEGDLVGFKTAPIVKNGVKEVDHDERRLNMSSLPHKDIVFYHFLFMKKLRLRTFSRLEALGPIPQAIVSLALFFTAAPTCSPDFFPRIAR